jgi:hypothetical protein
MPNSATQNYNTIWAVHNKTYTIADRNVINAQQNIISPPLTASIIIIDCACACASDRVWLGGGGTDRDQVGGAAEYPSGTLGVSLGGDCEDGECPELESDTVEGCVDDVISSAFMRPVEEEEEEGITEAEAEESCVGTPEKSPPYPRAPPILSFDFWASGTEDARILALGVVTKDAKARTTSSRVLTDPPPISFSFSFWWFRVREITSKGVEERGTLTADTAEDEDDNREEEEEEDRGRVLLLIFFNFGIFESSPIFSIFSSTSTSKSSSKSRSKLSLLLWDRDCSVFNCELILSRGSLKAESSGSEEAIWAESPEGLADSSNFRRVPDWGPPWALVL